MTGNINMWVIYMMEYYLVVKRMKHCHFNHINGPAHMLHDKPGTKGQLPHVLTHLWTLKNWSRFSVTQ